MGTQLPPKELELYRAIDEILWRDWDPIGVFGVSGARDEYQRYLPEVFRLALAGDRGGIAEHLLWVATDRMGLDPQRDRDLAIADLVLAARDRIVGGDK